MILFALAFLGGALTIASPCILPVLPFVFASAGQSFLRRGLPMLLGMAATFALVATLAAFGGGWAAHANQSAAASLSRCWPCSAWRCFCPASPNGCRRRWSLWAESCRNGPIPKAKRAGSARRCCSASPPACCGRPARGRFSASILTGAALQGASVGTTVLLLAYGLGAATSLALALLVGGRVFAAMKRSLGLGEWARRGFGAWVLAAVAAIALGVGHRRPRPAVAGQYRHARAGAARKIRARAFQGGSNDNSSVVMAPGENAMMAGAAP